MKRLVDAWHEHDIRVIYHLEGNLKPLMQELVDCGIDGINPCEKMNLEVEYVRSNYPSLVIWDGIDSSWLLTTGSLDEVEQEVKNNINICKDGGYILGSTGEIHPSCRLENILKMFEVANNYKL